MGELIRNLNTIKLGNEELMVELNEGGSDRTGKIIHIQNKDFRMEMWARDFLQLSATVLRAKSEMDYLKASQKNILHPTVRSHLEEPDEKTIGAWEKTKAELDISQIDYRIIDIAKDVITIIVRPDRARDFNTAIKRLRKIKRKRHPYSSVNGYVFLYKMKPFDMYIMDGVVIQIYYQLPCHSLTPKTWIPLDRIIQERIWRNGGAGDRLDDVDMMIYKICWAVFKRNAFSDNDIGYISSHKAVLSAPVFGDLMKKVFFNYAERLICDLRDDNFETAITNYLSYYE